MNEPIEVKIIENSDKIDWSIWFLSIAVLSLIAAVIIPFLQKKYEERKTKLGFHLYVKNRIGVVWNLLTYDKLEYKQPTSPNKMEELALTFDEMNIKWEHYYRLNKETQHPLFAFGIIFNFQNLLFTVNRIRYALLSIDIENLEEKTLQYGDKLSKKEHYKLNGLFLLIKHYNSITSFHDKFGSLKSIKREIMDFRWIRINTDDTLLSNQELILNDLQFLKENEISINEIIKINKLLIQEIRAYFKDNNLTKMKNKPIGANNVFTSGLA
jgi:hypothetical protein